LRRRHDHDKLTCFLFSDKAGIDTVLLPYNGSAEVAHGILTKSVDFVFDGPPPCCRSFNRAICARLPSSMAGRCRAARSADAHAASGVDLGDLTVWLGLLRRAARRPLLSTSSTARSPKS